MKAQSVRRTLTLVNALLLLGALGGAAWYVLRVRPAQADAGKAQAWVKPAMEAYQVAARNATPAVVYQVNEKDLEAIIRPDLTDVKKGAPGVFPYVGPVPPAPKPKAAVAAAPPPPKGLDALGRILMVIEGDPAVMLFQFTAGEKRLRPFGPGDRITDEPMKSSGQATGASGGATTASAGNDREAGLYLVRIDRIPGEGDPQYRIAYEVVREKGAPGEPQVATMSLKQAAAGKSATVLRGGPSAETPAAGPAGSKPLAEGVPPPLAEVKLVWQDVARDSRRLEFDDAAYRYFRYTDPDKLLGDVKTEDAKDEKGQPRGVRLTGVAEGSVGSQFGIVPGDIIKSINGQAVKGRAEAIDIVKGLPKDIESVAIVIERDGRDLLYNVDPRDPKVRSGATKARFGK